jgi:ferredoxin
MPLTSPEFPPARPTSSIGSAPQTQPALAFVARLQPGGQVFAAPADVALLLAAQQSGVVMPSSCRNGTCRACLRQLVSGTVTYRIAWPGVSPDEKRDGLILPCVAFAASDVVIAPPDST